MRQRGAQPRDGLGAAEQTQRVGEACADVSARGEVAHELEQRSGLRQSQRRGGALAGVKRCGVLGKGGVANSEKLAAEVISLPMHPYLDEPMQGRIIDSVRRALKQ